MGISEKGNPPVKWSETENVKWKVKIAGDGSNSTPIIWGDKIFLQTAVETDKKGEAKEPPAEEVDGGRRRGPRGRPPTNIYKFNLICLERKTGKLLWEKEVCEVLPHQGHHDDHGFASFSPVTDGKYVWANFGSRGVYCFDLNGKKLWGKELTQMTTRFGEGGSPALAGNALIVVADNDGDSFIYSFEKKSGEILWKKERDEGTTWATPMPVEVAGKLQVIVNATTRVRGYDAVTGDVIWQCEGQTRNVVPTPVIGHGMVYCASGFRGSALLAIELGKTGELTGTEAVRWEVKEGTPYVPSPLLYEDKLYVFSVNKAILSCYNAKTGEPYFKEEKLEGMNNVYASPVGAAGKVYFTGRGGEFCVIKLSDKLEVLAVNKLDDGFDCSPAIIGDELYLKGKEYLYCIAEP
jgi:outer membrane protein assembly factor BamB